MNIENIEFAWRKYGPPIQDFSQISSSYGTVMIFDFSHMHAASLCYRIKTEGTWSDWIEVDKAI